MQRKLKVSHDGNLNLTDGLQSNKLQDLYAWNNQRTPENPFVLYNFGKLARIIITFALLQNCGIRFCCLLQTQIPTIPTEVRCQ